MVCNVGGVDRVVRVLVGVIMATSSIMIAHSEATRLSLLAVSGLSLASSWFGICFINKLLGINTAK